MFIHTRSSTPNMYARNWCSGHPQLVVGIRSFSHSEVCFTVKDKSSSMGVLQWG